MMHKYFVTQGTKILSLFGWFRSLERMRSSGGWWGGALWRGEQNGQRRDALHSCWPIGGGSGGPRFEMKGKHSAGWSWLVSREVCGAVELEAGSGLTEAGWV